MNTNTQAQSDSVLTPLLQQYKDIKSENPNAILLFRCGDFYETFFEDAVLVAHELQITLTARGKNSGNPVPLAGVPYHSIDGYIAKLIHKGFTVAICEQVEDPKKAKGLVKREVVRIITPGTVADPNMLEDTSNNYLAAFAATLERFCLAAVDLSTGEVMLTIGDQNEMLMLPEEFTRLLPREILVLAENVDKIPSAPPWKHLNAEVHLRRISENEAVEMLCNLYPGEHRARFLAMPPLQLRTLGILASHLLDTQRCSLRHLSFPVDYRLGDGMVLDEATLSNLELLANGRQTAGGTLFDVLNRTRTSMGARTLKKWLLKPLVKKDAINRRLDQVEALVAQPLPLAEIRELLKGTPDLERILSKITLGGRNPRDLQALSAGLGRIPHLQRQLVAAGLNDLANSMQPMHELTDLLDSHLLEELPTNLSDGGVIAAGINVELDELRGLLKDGSEWLHRFEEQEKQRTGIRTLKVKKNSVFGYFIEISRSLADQAPDNYVRKQTLTTGERFITAELKDYENRVFTASDKSVAIEKDLYEELVTAMLASVAGIKGNAVAIAEADTFCSLAQLACENQYSRPVLHDDDTLCIVDGRHPVVEKFLGSGEFNPNDLLLDSNRRQAIITGPNMAGKSTFLRQTALIVLMAQIGSYVPAASADIGIVDRIFTRVGASDNLVRGQSTFMVEMMEASAILKSATARSLLILDEIGRGTSTFDGLSLAWSILEHINLQLSARTLFATHYHELTDLDTVHPGVFNLNVGVSHDEDSGKMVFLHKIDEGAASKSYGIEVARLAGLPGSVVDRAREILFELEKTEHDELGRVTRGLKPQTRPQQLNLFSPGNELIEAVARVDVNNITPLEALNLLQRLKGMTNGR